MARARTLVPGFFTDERIVSVSMPARLLFQGLWTEADREGRLEDKPLVLKMRLFPVDPVDVGALLGELCGAGLITRYEVGGRRCLLVPKFKEHQHVHPREAPSKLPGPPLTDEARELASCMEEQVNLPSRARENASCMTVEPGKGPRGEGVNQSAVQALGCSGPSGPSAVHALGPSVAIKRAPSNPVAVPPEDKNSHWVQEAKAFIDWAKSLDSTLADPGPVVTDWAEGFFLKHQPADQRDIRAAFGSFLVWAGTGGRTPGWGLWVREGVWLERWNTARAERGAA